jgi:hypothetical protein
MYKAVIVFLFMSIFRLNAQNDTVYLIKADKTIPLISGTNVKITTTSELKLKGKLSFHVDNDELYFVAGKDTVNASQIQVIKLYNKGTRVGGSIVTGTGAVTSLYGLAIIVAGIAEYGEPGSWAGLTIVIGGMYAVISLTVAGVGLLVRSIGKKYTVPEWEINVVKPINTAPTSQRIL